MCIYTVYTYLYVTYEVYIYTSMYHLYIDIFANCNYVASAELRHNTSNSTIHKSKFSMYQTRKSLTGIPYSNLATKIVVRDSGKGNTEKSYAVNINVTILSIKTPGFFKLRLIFQVTIAIHGILTSQHLQNTGRC